MKKTNILAVSILLSLFAIVSISIQPAHAHCPLCTAATGAGIVVAEKYGVDDAIIGLWVGAFVISTALWFDRLLKKKYNFPAQGAILSVSSLALTVVPFYFAGMFANPVKILGIDRLLFGILFGSIMTFAGTWLSVWIKNTRGKVLFPYQTIILVTGILTATSLVFQYLARNTGVLG